MIIQKWQIFYLIILLFELQYYMARLPDEMKRSLFPVAPECVKIINNDQILD